MSLNKTSSNRVANGVITKYSFTSTSLGGLETNVNVYVPDIAKSSPVPVLFYLAGLTCTEDTGAQKGGLLNQAGKEDIALVFPDTSPRGAGVEGEDDDWQLGTGESLGSGEEGLQGGIGMYSGERRRDTAPRFKRRTRLDGVWWTVSPR